MSQGTILGSGKLAAKKTGKVSIVMELRFVRGVTDSKQVYNKQAVSFQRTPPLRGE